MSAFKFFIISSILPLLLFVYYIQMNSRLLSVDYEVFGRVQGVFFRKYTQKEGAKLGLKGWVMNKPSGTVAGVMQGERQTVDEMKRWLSSKGSPMSRIDRCEFNNEREISQYEYDSFQVRHY